MKTKKKVELDVDFIGGTGPLTKEEEKKISQFIQSRKMKANVVSGKRRQKTTAPKKERV